MRICVVGAGAIGGVIAARLAAAADAEVSVLARGATLSAIREHGLRVSGPVTDGLGGTSGVRVAAADDAAARGPQDCAGVGAAARPLDSVDPGGFIASVLPAARVIGGTVPLSAAAPAPGEVSWRSGNRLIIGELDGSPSPRLDALTGALRAAGFEVSVSPRIRDDVWYKLWGNLTLNPICALTNASTGPALDDDLVRDFISRAMLEARAIGERIGCPIAQSPEDRHAVTRKLGDFVPSMLQDARAGRPLELDALTGAVRELGALVGVPTPYVDAIHGLTRLWMSGL